MRDCCPNKDYFFCFVEKLSQPVANPSMSNVQDTFSSSSFEASAKIPPIYTFSVDKETDIYSPEH